MAYTKLPLSIADQIALLKSRGLTFADEADAAKVLENISYYRFAAYLRPMESDKTTHNLHAGASFEDVLAIYEFDSKLRAIVFNAIQKIEISIRSKMIHEFSLAHGAFINRSENPRNEGAAPQEITAMLLCKSVNQGVRPRHKTIICV